LAQQLKSNQKLLAMKNSANVPAKAVIDAVLTRKITLSVVIGGKEHAGPNSQPTRREIEWLNFLANQRPFCITQRIRKFDPL
jgi:hypothetical protein